ncbi:NPCBM/NEW2 domain-containing protein [Flammeovirga aprica]|uniref:Glycosyl hydrolase family 98 putative carbohydrate-binding module domain-containing protein n=1 Tax=Flammeovirga aprica JL-4 TaxID=694437 RepID=A0A7X9XAX5_9BACT|nr:NPCBM/NEW2 domain-containing protein [Flammeovirga aprica]NME70136.1 hypothetical protein [Flammeovirga aprica JL-4]
MKSIIVKSIQSLVLLLTLSVSLSSNLLANDGASNKGKVFLTKEMASAKESYWRVMNDKSVSGAKLMIKGKSFEKGLGVHADSKITFDVTPDYKLFHVVPGADDAHHGTIEMKIMVDDKEVYNSGKINSERQKSPESVTVDLAGVKKLTLVVEQAEDDKGGDHADWADAYFITDPEAVAAANKAIAEKEAAANAVANAAAKARVLNNNKIKVKEKKKVYVSKSLMSSNKSYWKVNENQSVSGAKIQIKGKTFARGLGVHANSRISFSVKPDYKYFHVVPGADDAHTGTVLMKILIDGQEVYNSGKINRESQPSPQSVMIDLKDAQKVTLVVEEADGDKGGDHADWADAYFVNK